MNPESPAPPNNRWPPQIKYIVGNEACERFSFYGMKGILALYITTVLLKTENEATNIIHLFGFVNYFTPLLGAWVSDRYWGRYHTILWVSLFYCLGHGVLAASDFIATVDGKLICLYIGIGLIAFGAGGIKPCVGAFMGDQFKPDQQHLLRKAYALFYWSVNVGSVFSFLIIPAIRKSYGYSWAFGVPGIFMALSTFIFWLGTKHYLRVPPSRETRTAGFFTVLIAACRQQAGLTAGVVLNLVVAFVIPAITIMALALVALAHETTPLVRAIGWVALVGMGLSYLLIVVMSLFGKFELPEGFWQAARNKFSESEIAAARSVSPIIFVFTLIPVFWALFDQTFSTWVLQGGKMVPYQIGNWTIGPEEMLSANPLFVMIFLPIMTWWVYPKLGRLATPLRRMSAGMFLGAASFVIVAVLQNRIEAGAQLSVLWQVVPYVIITLAEVLVSTTGLEFAFREAAAEMKSMMIGLWWLTVAVGNLLVSAFTKVLAETGGGHGDAVSTNRFLTYAGLTFVVAIAFSIVAAFYRYRDTTAAEGK